MKAILLFILAGVWIEYNELPIFPLGFVLVLLWVRPINFKRYKFLILAMVLGFIGTGFSFKIFEQVSYNHQTGKEHYFSKYLFHIGLGTKNITQILSRNTFLLYKDNRHQKEQKLLDNYLRDFVPSYNESNASFSEMRKEYGKIEDMYYIGYIEKVLFPIVPTDLQFVYKVKFVENPSWRTIHFRIAFPKGKLQVFKMEVQDSNVKYKTPNQ